jgi:hypothetical protein
MMITLMSCDRFSSYGRFMKHDQAYYAQVATACDELRVKIPTSFTNGQVIQGDNESLPTILRQLNANKIEIETNRVSIMVHDSRLGFGIVWEPSNYDNVDAPWVLQTYAEDIRKVVYSGKTSAVR